LAVRFRHGAPAGLCAGVYNRARAALGAAVEGAARAGVRFYALPMAEQQASETVSSASTGAPMVAADGSGRSASGVFEHVPHPWIAARQHSGPVQVAEQHRRSGPVSAFNAAFAVRITGAVGSMWCAYVFAAIALIGLPGAIAQGTLGIVQWIAQTYLQLVLLSIIIVGQNVQAAASDKRAESTYQDAEAVLHEAIQIQAHLHAQDQLLQQLIAANQPARPQP